MSKNKIIIISGSVIGLIFLLILILWLISLFSNKYYSYEEFEDEVVVACKNYYKKYPEVLPSEDGEYNVDYNILVQEKLIKPINKMIEGGDKCSINIILTKKANDYTYNPLLTCPGKYEKKELYKKVLEQNKVVTSGNGLYQNQDGEYYFRGEITNNYIQLGNYEDNENKTIAYLWQILSIENDGTMRIRSTLKTKEKYVWDDRYNADKNTNYGYNAFEKSRMKETLKSFSQTNIILDTNYKEKFIPRELCIGSIDETESTMDKTGVCKTLSTDKYLFGIMYPYEYLRASLDTNCKNISNKSCANYNYLAKESITEWTLNAYSKDNYKVFGFLGNEYYYSRASNTKRIYPAGYLNNNVFYKSGNGSIEDPYIIR